MTDVLIKGMEMPKDGEMLCLDIYPDGKVSINLDLACAKIAQAVELPPHGRLKDADELRAAMYHEAFEKDSDMQRWDSGCWIRYKMFEKVIEAAPTVIDASEYVGHCDSCYWRQNVKDPDDLIQDHCEVCEWCEVEQDG